MTTPNHAVTGGLIYVAVAKALSIDTEIALTSFFWIGAFIGAMPDIASWIFRLWLPNDYTFHNALHYREVNKKLRWTVAWGLHTWLDSIVHKPTGGVNKWYVPLEVMTWGGNIGLALFLFG